MGMWDRDILYGGERLDAHVNVGETRQDAEEVALFDIVIVSDEVPTDLGNATKTALVICKLSADGTKTEGKPLEVNTLAQAVAEKARTKGEGDLPAVVCFFKAPAGTEGFSDATVMQFVRRWDGKVPEYTPLAETIPY
jgi:hypothetical protein